MELQITLAGANFRPKEVKELIKTIVDGEPCTLVRARENPYDERAVEIHYNGTFIGFVPKSDNLALSQAMDADEAFTYTCVCTGFIGTYQPTFSIHFQAPWLVEQRKVETPTQRELPLDDEIPF